MFLYKFVFSHTSLADKFQSGEPQTVNHIVESCPLTTLADLKNYNLLMKTW